MESSPQDSSKTDDISYNSLAFKHWHEEFIDILNHRLSSGTNVTISRLDLGRKFSERSRVRITLDSPQLPHVLTVEGFLYFSKK